MSESQSQNKNVDTNSVNHLLRHLFRGGIPKLREIGKRHRFKTT